MVLYCLLHVACLNLTCLGAADHASLLAFLSVDVHTSNTQSCSGQEKEASQKAVLLDNNA